MGKGKVLITGGAGFIGSHTADLLIAEGYEVHILDNLTEQIHDGCWPDYLDSRIEKIKGDVSRFEDLEKALEGIDYVFHLAAYQDLLPNFSKFFSVNTVSTALLYELIVNRKFPIKKVVFASSQFVYGEGHYQCSEHGLFHSGMRTIAHLDQGKWDVLCPHCQKKASPALLTEESFDPQNQYSISKYTQELIALTFGKRYQIPTVGLRYSIVQGARQSFRNAYSGILRVFTLKMLKGEPPPVFEDGLQFRDYVNVLDVARANVLVLQKKEANWNVFNVGGGKAYTVLDFVSIVNQVLKTNIQQQITHRYRVGDTRHSISNIEKIRSLGWSPTRTPKNSVEAYVQWIQKQNLKKDYVAEAENLMEKTGCIRKAVTPK